MTDYKSFWCPSCEKPLLKKKFGEKPSLEKQKFKDRNGNELELFVDICDKCKKRLYRKHFEPTEAQIKDVLKALQNEQPTEKSLEEML